MSGLTRRGIAHKNKIDRGIEAAIAEVKAAEAKLRRLQKEEHDARMAELRAMEGGYDSDGLKDAAFVRTADWGWKPLAKVNRKTVDIHLYGDTLRVPIEKVIDHMPEARDE